MAIRVIECGPDIDSQIYRVTCVFCQSVIEFRGDDARNLCLPGANWKVIDCPVCACQISAGIETALAAK